MKIYDSVIVGGGPSGLSAAIYLARFNRSALVIDKEKDGRWDTYEVNENYLGFPDGIKTRELRERGLVQAKKFGAEYVIDHIYNARQEDDLFVVESQTQSFIAKTLIIATGVVDLFPHFDKWRDFIGRSIYWCITCDGWKTKDKKIVVIAQDDEGVETAFQFLTYTKDITVITDCYVDCHTVSEKNLQLLKEKGIGFHEGVIKSIVGKEGMCETISLEDGSMYEVEVIISQRGATPNSDIARQLGVELGHGGYILTDNDQRTNLPFVYAAGDVTKSFAHQVATAVHEGSMAGQRANYDLYEPFQRGK